MVHQLRNPAMNPLRHIMNSVAQCLGMNMQNVYATPERVDGKCGTRLQTNANAISMINHSIGTDWNVSATVKILPTRLTNE